MDGGTLMSRPLDKTLAVAKYVRALDPHADSLKTQKLLYFIQGSYLAQTGSLLFPELPQAWRYGPVYPSLYRADAAPGNEVERADAGLLSDAQRRLIEGVVAEYRDVRPGALVFETHQPGPWTEARGDLPEDARSSKELSVESMMRFFSEHGRAPSIPGLVEELRWEVLPDGFIEAEEERWAELLERLGS